MAPFQTGSSGSLARISPASVYAARLDVLNGYWEYAIRPENGPMPQKYDGQILVPFCVESALSGVQRALLPNEKLWYRRNFEVPALKEQRLLLHFGAVDHGCELWLNGEKLGSHTGGFLPFSFDITLQAKPAKTD